MIEYFVDPIDIAAYLSNIGWKLDDNDKGKFHVLLGPGDATGNPIEVPLPKENINTKLLYIKNALDILATFYDKEPGDLAHDIQQYDRDVLMVRVIDVENAVPLSYAADHLADLRRFIAYGARSEIDQKPFYLDTNNSTAKRLTSQYRFGHTFKGSFGFSIETPKIANIQAFKQLSMWPAIVEQKTEIPIERRVMMRIARGLMLTNSTYKSREFSDLINNYKSAFNANMCLVMKSMIQNTPGYHLEYSVKWSAIKPPEDSDLRTFRPILFGSDAGSLLQYAADQISYLQPERVTITGFIKELNASDSPALESSDRTIGIEWRDPIENRRHFAKAVLSAEHYQLAINAHWNWNNVRITGLLARRGKEWQFIDYSDFEVLPQDLPDHEFESE